jgi:beta-glucosidase
MKYLKIISLLLLPACMLAQPLTNHEKAKKLAAQMTLDEKAHFVVGMGMKIPGMNLGGGPAVGITEDKVPGAAGTSFAIPRLQLPTTVYSDGPAGLRISPFRGPDSSKTYYATAFPVGTLLASTWDTALVNAVGKSMGNEVKEYGVDFLLGPGVNIQRNPLGGRNFEYYSEDPVLSGNIAAAIINGVQSNGVGTSIKHFAANNQETNRNQVNTIVSERALREIYLRGFEIAVKKAQPWTVMSSYNKINGPYTSHNYDLLTTILRKEWGFKGFVMTDWFGGSSPVEQVKAGNDLLMPGTAAQAKAIVDAVNNKELDEKNLTDNVEHILNVYLETPAFGDYAFSNNPDLKKHGLLVRSAAAEGMVLLKNNVTLPLSKSISKVAAFGNTSYAFIAGGTGSGDVNEAYTVSLVEGLTNAGLPLDEEVKTTYVSYLNEFNTKHPKKNFFQEFMNPTPPAPELEISTGLLTKKAEESDIAIITIGRNAGEGADRKVQNDFYLADAEKALIKNVSEAFHAKGKKLVVIINSGGVIDIASWRDQADAILLAWQGGQEGGNAVADILTGKVNPSGKLTATFPVKYEDDITAKNFPGKNISKEQVKGIGGFGMGFESEVVYEEGVYVGYRYYNTFGIKPAYEFGFGLSYTNFNYSNLTLSSKDFNGSTTVTVDVTNAGKLPGREVAELYLSSPAVSVDKPVAELKAFGKTALLKPGEKQTLTFKLLPKDLASFVTVSSEWIADAGNYTVSLGASSLNIKQKASFNLGKQIVVEKVHKVLIPQVQITELKR